MATGHRLAYMRLFSRALLELQCRVIALCPWPGAVNDWLVAQGVPCERFHGFEFNDEVITSPAWRLRRVWVPLARWHKLAAAVRRAGTRCRASVDLVFLCWADSYLYDCSRLAAALLPAVFRHRWSGLYFHPRHLRDNTRPDAGLFSCSDHVLRTRRCTGITVLDEGIKEALEKRAGCKVVAFPDVADVSGVARDSAIVGRIARAGKGRLVIGLVGYLARRKGVLTLLRAAKAASGKPWVFVFAGLLGEAELASYRGREGDEIDELRFRPPPNCLTYFGHIPDEPEFNAIVESCDVLFAAYDDFYHSSNILAKGAAFHKPVIVEDGYCMAERVREFRLGEVLQGTTPEDVIRAIQRLEATSDAPGEADSPEWQRYREVHSAARLKDAFREVIRMIG